MSAPAWLNDRIFYQIFPERFANGDPANDPAGTADWDRDRPTRENFFGGDLAGIQQHIPHLQRLGVNALYLTPIFTAGSNHKYDTWDYLNIDPAFGALADFQSLVASLKAGDIRLMLDAVFNHCGGGFGPFQEVIARGTASGFADWFIVDRYPVQLDPPSYQTCGGAPFLPKLNTNNPQVQDFLLKVVDIWLARGIDGWRLDVPWKANMELWRRLRQQIEARHPNAYLVSEVWRGTADWTRGDTVHGVMNYRLRQNILDYAALDHMDAEDFDYELQYLLREHGETAPDHLTLLGSHDTPRIRTVCRGDVGRIRIAITLQMTLPGIPMIYYGDEIGMEGENDPDCRRPMIWEESRWNSAIWDTTRALVRLRRSRPWLRFSAQRILKSLNGVYSYVRQNNEECVIVVLNPRGALPRFGLTDEVLGGSCVWVDWLSGREWTADSGTLEFSPLPAQSVFVLVSKENR